MESLEMSVFMNVLPTWEAAFVLIGGTVLLTVGIALMVRRTRAYAHFSESGDFISVMYPMIGAIYGVVLAFSIVLSWQRFAQAETHSSAEVVTLSSIWRNSQAFPCDARDQVERQLMEYARSVLDCEWHSLAGNGAGNIQTAEVYEGLWDLFLEHRPVGDIEKAFYEKGLERLNSLGMQRRYRIMSASAEISRVVWVFLFMGGLVTIGIPMILWNTSPVVHGSLTAVLAFIVAFSIWIVAALQYPYSGDVSVSSSPWTSLVNSFERRRAGTVEHCGIEPYEAGPADCDAR